MIELDRDDLRALHLLSRFGRLTECGDSCWRMGQIRVRAATIGFLLRAGLVEHREHERLNSVRQARQIALSRAGVDTIARYRTIAPRASFVASQSTNLQESAPDARPDPQNR